MSKPNDPKKAAAELLQACWADGRIPVDPVLIAHQLGVRVHRVSLPANHSGALVKREGGDPVILLQEGDSTNRQRFTCAHELGHYVRRAGDDAFGFVDLRSSLSEQGTNPEEIFANRFAANLLMPEDAVRERIGRNAPDIVILANEFQVSAEAMRFRLRNLGILRDE